MNLEFKMMDFAEKAPKLEQMSMVEKMNTTTSTDWIVQKYVETPALIDGKKWDLRMWAVVTCWNPLTVWWYMDGYLRFAIRDFSLDGAALEDAIAHVTNIEFQRESGDLQEVGVDWAQVCIVVHRCSSTNSTIPGLFWD